MQALTPTLLEATTAFYTFVLVDENDVGIDASVLDTLTLHYYDQTTLAVLNSRDHQNVYNAQQVTIATAPGPPLVTIVTWELQPADTAIVSPGRALEVHCAIFRWTWASGTRTNAHAVSFGIENLIDAP
jgi:hypothetical protein